MTNLTDLINHKASSSDVTLNMSDSQVSSDSDIEGATVAEW